MRFQSVWRMEDFTSLFFNNFFFFVFGCTVFAFEPHNSHETSDTNVEYRRFSVSRSTPAAATRMWMTNMFGVGKLAVRAGIRWDLCCNSDGARARAYFPSVCIRVRRHEHWTHEPVHAACLWSFCLFVCFFPLAVLFGYRCKLRIGRRMPMMAYWNRSLDDRMMVNVCLSFFFSPFVLESTAAGEQCKN